MKYLVLSTPQGERPVIFPSTFNHSWMAGQMAPMTVVSAGFVVLEDGKLRCFGRSESLRIPARPERDTALVAEQIMRQ